MLVQKFGKILPKKAVPEGKITFSNYACVVGYEHFLAQKKILHLLPDYYQNCTVKINVFVTKLFEKRPDF